MEFDNDWDAIDESDEICVHDPPKTFKKKNNMQKIENAESMAKRRGPTDEMRQFVRILVQVIPATRSVLTRVASMPQAQRNADKGSGTDTSVGNKLNSWTMHAFLAEIFGEARWMPDWGVSEGWSEWLASFLSDVLDQPVTQREAYECAYRPAGRSWRANTALMFDMDLYADYWLHFPMTVVSVRRENSIGKDATRSRIAKRERLSVVRNAFTSTSTSVGPSGMQSVQSVQVDRSVRIPTIAAPTHILPVQTQVMPVPGMLHMLKATQEKQHAFMHQQMLILESIAAHSNDLEVLHVAQLGVGQMMADMAKLHLKLTTRSANVTSFSRIAVLEAALAVEKAKVA